MVIYTKQNIAKHSMLKEHWKLTHVIHLLENSAFQKMSKIYAYSYMHK